MKFLPSFLALAIAAGIAAAADSPSPVAPLFSVSFPDNPDLAASVASYLQTHASIPAVPAPAPDAPALDPAPPFAIRFDSFPSPADFFVDPDSPSSRIVNLSRLADPGESPDPDVNARRAGQLALCAAASCFGLEPCPFPLCVLRPHRRPSDLDSMSRNLCPPCRDRLISVAASRSLSLLPLAHPAKP